MKAKEKPINEPNKRLSATLEEHIKIPHQKDRNIGAATVRRIFKPLNQWISRLEKSPRGREALGFISMTLSR